MYAEIIATKHTSHTAPRVTIQTKTQHPSHPLQKLQHSKAKNTIFNNGHYTTNFPTDPHTITTTDTKINIRHIHTSIVYRHLAIRGNNKILHTPPPHIISSEEIHHRLTRRTLAQLRTNKSLSNHVYTKSTQHPSLQLHPH